MQTDGLRKARLYFFGFFLSIAGEAIVNIFYLGKIRELFDAAPDDVVLMNLGIYTVLVIAFSAGIMYCFFNSRKIRKEIGKTRWTI
jgi:hypothetical protein